MQANWPIMQVFPLNENEKKEIITGYMSMYAKTLNEVQTALIVDAKQSRNPLYLKALLDEVSIGRNMIENAGNSNYPSIINYMLLWCMTRSLSDSSIEMELLVSDEMNMNIVEMNV